MKSTLRSPSIPTAGSDLFLQDLSYFLGVEAPTGEAPPPDEQWGPFHFHPVEMARFGDGVWGVKDNHGDFELYFDGTKWEHRDPDKDISCPRLEESRPQTPVKTTSCGKVLEMANAFLWAEKFLRPKVATLSLDERFLVQSPEEIIPPDLRRW